jgi:hypothetical protein
MMNEPTMMSRIATVVINGGTPVEANFVEWFGGRGKPPLHSGNDAGDA